MFIAQKIEKGLIPKQMLARFVQKREMTSEQVIAFDVGFLISLCFFLVLSGGILFASLVGIQVDIRFYWGLFLYSAIALLMLLFFRNTFGAWSEFVLGWLALRMDLGIRRKEEVEWHALNKRADEHALENSLLFIKARIETFLLKQKGRKPSFQIWNFPTTFKCRFARLQRFGLVRAKEWYLNKAKEKLTPEERANLELVEYAERAEEERQDNAWRGTGGVQV